MENKIKGTRDYFGKDGKKIEFAFNVLTEIANKYAYEKIIMPTFENTNLFSRSVGDGTDVVNKEMYTFKDKKGRSISLRPEGTAGTTRLVIENKLIDNNANPSLYYIANMFRYERPQKGRQREFFQFGIEKFGEDCYMVDVEIIQFAIDILKTFNISKYTLQINSIGDSEAMNKYNEVLKEFVLSKTDKLSEYAREKINSNNILRIFDSKDEKDLKILEESPSIKDFLSNESKKRFEKFAKTLRLLGVEFKINDKLVRGLDYYNDLVFEFVSTDSEKLGSKSTIIGGGRYNSLVSKIDPTKKSPGIGFALGIERLVLASEDFINKKINNKYNYYIATAYNESDMDLAANKIAISLRNKSHSVMVDYRNKKLSKKIENAEKLSEKIIIVGNEIKDGKITIKDFEKMESKVFEIKEI